MPPEPLVAQPSFNCSRSFGFHGSTAPGSPSATPEAKSPRARSPGSPKRAASPETNVNQFFDLGATRRTYMDSSGLSRHVLTQSLDRQAAEHLTHISSLSLHLQGPIDTSAAATPTSGGHAAPLRSPYLSPASHQPRTGCKSPGKRPYGASHLARGVPAGRVAAEPMQTAGAAAGETARVHAPGPVLKGTPFGADPNPRLAAVASYSAPSRPAPPQARSWSTAHVLSTPDNNGGESHSAGAAEGAAGSGALQRFAALYGTQRPSTQQPSRPAPGGRSSPQPRRALDKHLGGPLSTGRPLQAQPSTSISSPKKPLTVPPLSLPTPTSPPVMPRHPEPRSAWVAYDPLLRPSSPGMPLLDPGADPSIPYSGLSHDFEGAIDRPQSAVTAASNCSTLSATSLLANAHAAARIRSQLSQSELSERANAWRRSFQSPTHGSSEDVYGMRRPTTSSPAAAKVPAGSGSRAASSLGMATTAARKGPAQPGGGSDSEVDKRGAAAVIARGPWKEAPVTAGSLDLSGGALVAAATATPRLSITKTTSARYDDRARGSGAVGPLGPAGSSCSRRADSDTAPSSPQSVAPLLHVKGAADSSLEMEVSAMAGAADGRTGREDDESQRGGWSSGFDPDDGIFTSNSDSGGMSESDVGRGRAQRRGRSGQGEARQCPLSDSHGDAEPTTEREGTDRRSLLDSAEQSLGAGASPLRSSAQGTGLGRRQQQRQRPTVFVDPELVRHYTERPPKLRTPNNAFRPVTSSDFAAFKTHTVSRSGTPNTLRTALGGVDGADGGSADGATAASGTGSRSPGAAILHQLAGPPWVPLASRPRSPHLGVGGVLGSAKNVPGLHVPMDIEPMHPPRTPPRCLPKTPHDPNYPNFSHSAAGGSSRHGVSPDQHPMLTDNDPPGNARGLSQTPASIYSSFGARSALNGYPQPQAPRVHLPHLRAGTGELPLDVDAWLTPPAAPGSEVCGLFGGDDGTDSVSLLSRVVKGVANLDLGWVEVSESLMFMAGTATPNAMFRFPLPPRSILQRFAATIGRTTVLADAVLREGPLYEDDDGDEDDPMAPGKAQLKAFGRRSQHGPGKGGPVLRVPLGKVKGDIFVTVSYIVHLETAGNIMSLTHVSTWKPPRTGWHVARDAAVAAAAAGQAAGAAAAAALGAHTQKDAGGSPGGAHKGHAAHVAAGAAPAAAPAGGSGGRRGHRGKASDLYDLTFELEVISHRGLNQVSGPKHVTVRPKYDALLVQGYSQVWKPRHVTTVTFEVALPAPVRSFSMLQDGRQPGAQEDEAASLSRGGTLSTEPSVSALPGALGSTGTSSGGATDPWVTPGRSKGIHFIPPTLTGGTGDEDEGGKVVHQMSSCSLSTGAKRQVKTYSHRNVVAVTFVPSSHFTAAELEECLGEEVAPGPRAAAAAMRAAPGGNPPVPAPLPVELLLVLDCCGPTGMAMHLMQLLQALMVLLRSLPTEGGSAATTGPDGVGSVLASAATFNVVVCPAAPPVEEEDMGDLDTLMGGQLSPELAALQQLAKAAGGEGGALQQEELRQEKQQLKPAAPPVWLFPEGSRPVCGPAVEEAMYWIKNLLSDLPLMISWAQPVTCVHELLDQLAALPRVGGVRRSALLLCHAVRPRDPASMVALSAALTPANALSVQGSRAFSRSASRAQRTLSRQASRMPGRASGGMAAPAPSLVVLQSGTASVGSVGGGGAAASASTTTVGGGGADSEPTTPRRGRIWQPLTSPIPEGVASSQGDFEGEEEEAAGAAAATEFRDAGEDVVLPERAESPQGLAAVATEGSLAPPEADLSEGTAAALTAAAAAAVTAVKASPPVPVAPARHAGEEPITASGSVHWSQGVSDSQPRSIPLHVHHCISAVRPAAAEAAVLETDAEGTAAQQPQRRGPGRHLSFSAAHPSVAVAATSPRAWEEPAGHTAQGAVSSEGEEMEEAEGSCQELQPPDLGFRVFVVVHELQIPTMGAGAGGSLVINAAGPSYLLPYHVYQKHLEGLLYDQARDDVVQVPRSYLTSLADMNGGYVQVVTSELQLPPALVLAASCALSGRYLRGLRLVAHRAALREHHPVALPPALPLDEPLSLVARLSRTQLGAVLTLEGTWPCGRPASLEVSVDPRQKAPGQLLPLLCALSEVSSLLQQLPPAALPRGTATPHNGHRPTTTAQPPPALARHRTDAVVGSTATVELTPPQQVARKRIIKRASAFNLPTPLTIMTLVSMTMTEAKRGMGFTMQSTAQQLLTSGLRLAAAAAAAVDQRPPGFTWPAPLVSAFVHGAGGGAGGAPAAAAGTSGPQHRAGAATPFVGLGLPGASLAHLDVPEEVAAAVSVITAATAVTAAAQMGAAGVSYPGGPVALAEGTQGAHPARSTTPSAKQLAVCTAAAAEEEEEEQQHTQQQLLQVLQAVAETAAATATAAVSGQVAEASAVASASATTVMQSAEPSKAPASEPQSAPAQKEPSAASAASSSSTATPVDALSQASSTAPPSSLPPRPLVASARTARRRSLVLLEQSGIFSGMGVAERRASALGLTAGNLGGTASGHGSTGLHGPRRSPSASFAGGPMWMGSMPAGAPTAPRAPAHARRSTPAGDGLPGGSESGGPQAAGAPQPPPKRMGSATGSVSWLTGTAQSWTDGGSVGEGGRAPSEASSDGTGLLAGDTGVALGHQPGDLAGGPLAPVAESPEGGAEGGESGESSFAGIKGDTKDQQAAAGPGDTQQAAVERQEGEPLQQQQQEDESPDTTTHASVDGDSLAAQETATQPTGPPVQALELQVPASPHPPPTECGSVLGPTLSGGVGTARQGPIGPPMTTSMVAAARTLTMLSELASLQAADGSWPEGPELLELVLGNGRNLAVPGVGGPLPQSPAGRSARNRNDAALREALEAVRQGGGEGEGGQGLRGEVDGALWGTVLAMALLRAKYIVQRPAWVALEARAYAFLEARWPRSVALSPASAIMRVATLL